jgi:hypothetical protein
VENGDQSAFEYYARANKNNEMRFSAENAGIITPIIPAGKSTACAF